MRILGIDPSLTGCGLAVIEDGVLEWSAVVKTTTKDEGRLNLIFDAVRRAIDVDLLQSFRTERNFENTAIAIEGYAYNARFQREQMGEVGGVIRLAIHRAGLPPPAVWANKSWQKVALGRGDFVKNQVRLEVYKRYGVEIKDDNQLEAYCVAMAEHLARTGAKRPVPKRSRKLAEEVA
jgi:Holliday junction resolvasome RuvABC endonuclease subunit